MKFNVRRQTLLGTEKIRMILMQREHKTGLEGIFWIDADVHTWKNHNYDTMLTLNCRNVAATASAGSEIE